MPRVLITGAGRGIGLALAKAYAAAGWQVLACARAPENARALRRLADGGRVAVHRLDVTRDGDIAALAQRLAGSPIDLLISNAGLYGPRGRQKFGDIDYAAWREVIPVNLQAPVKLAEAFCGPLAAAERAVLAVISSQMGSIARASGGAYIYRTSKAAVNMAVKLLATDLRGRGITVVALHPGWVRTDMGGRVAPMGARQSAARLRALLGRITPADNGKFLNYDGAEIPW